MNEAFGIEERLMGQLYSCKRPHLHKGSVSYGNNEKVS
jgi:hypothetical protein